MRLKTVRWTGVVAAALGVILVSPPSATADSGEIYSAGNDCKGQWLSGPNDFRIMDRAGGGDNDYCYIDYGSTKAIAGGSSARRLTLCEDCYVGQWRYFTNPDLSGIGSTIWIKVCEERENDPDLCSNVGGYAK